MALWYHSRYFSEPLLYEELSILQKGWIDIRTLKGAAAEHRLWTEMVDQRRAEGFLEAAERLFNRIPEVLEGVHQSIY